MMMSTTMKLSTDPLFASPVDSFPPPFPRAEESRFFVLPAEPLVPDRRVEPQTLLLRPPVLRSAELEWFECRVSLRDDSAREPPPRVMPTRGLLEPAAVLRVERVPGRTPERGAFVGISMKIPVPLDSAQRTVMVRASVVRDGYTLAPLPPANRRQPRNHAIKRITSHHITSHVT